MPGLDLYRTRYYSGAQPARSAFSRRQDYVRPDAPEAPVDPTPQPPPPSGGGQGQNSPGTFAVNPAATLPGSTNTWGNLLDHAAGAQVFGTPTPFGNFGATALPPAPTQAQVNENPAQFAGTSFDPARNINIDYSQYGRLNTGGGFGPDPGPDIAPLGYAPTPQNIQANPNHAANLARYQSIVANAGANPWAGFLSSNDPNARAIGMAMAGGQTPMERAQGYLGLYAPNGGLNAGAPTFADFLKQQYGVPNVG